MAESSSSVHALRYEGHAEAVRLATWMPRFSLDTRFHRHDGGWELSLTLPTTVRIEYRIEVERDGAWESLLDPRNPMIATNPFGRNSVLTGPDYELPAWIVRHPARPGSRSELRVVSRSLGGRRSIRLYRPAGLSDEVEAPLLFVFDGSDYADHAGLVQCFDVLIEDGAVPPFRAVLSDPRARHDEYVGSEAHASCMLEEVVPHVGRRVAVGPLAAMGASLGAVAAWKLADTAPEEMLGVVLQSGTFARSDHSELDDRMLARITAFVDAAMDRPLPDHVAVHQSCGRYESLIDWNRDVAEVLGAARSRFRYVETWTGHDWGAWRDQLAPGLRLALSGVAGGSGPHASA